MCKECGCQDYSHKKKFHFQDQEHHDHQSHEHDQDPDHDHTHNHTQDHNHDHDPEHTHDEHNSHEHNHDHKHESQNGKVSAQNIVTINRSVTETNDALAESLSESFRKKGILCINLLGSPGSGKTSFIEGVSAFLGPANLAVIQGDLESDIDKKRLEKRNIMTYQINTHSGCHLNAMMIEKAVSGMDLSGKRYLIIENVGNLVCPAGVRIGEHINVVVSSTTEGSDKPKKYPYIFMDAHLIVISKSDIAEHVGFDEKSYLADIKDINGRAKIVKTSTRNSASFREPAAFLEHEREHLLGKEHAH